MEYILHPKSETNDRIKREESFSNYQRQKPRWLVMRIIWKTCWQQMRFVGHGVGLELDEYPVLRPLDHLIRSGMTVALEPKLIYPTGCVGD